MDSFYSFYYGIPLLWKVIVRFLCCVMHAGGSAFFGACDLGKSGQNRPAGPVLETQARCSTIRLSASLGACDRTEGCLGMVPLPPSSQGAPFSTGVKCSAIAPGLWPSVLVDRSERRFGQPSDEAGNLQVASVC